MNWCVKDTLGLKSLRVMRDYDRCTFLCYGIGTLDFENQGCI